MPTTILVAGATGAIGRRLLPRLVAAGHRVIGVTRDAAKADGLLALGALPLVADVFDADRLRQSVMAAKPDIVIHQLTDLPRNLDPSRMEEGVRRNARIRGEGTANLVKAAEAAGVRRIVAQSIAWAYAPGPSRFAEDDALDLAASGLRAISVGGVAALEGAVLGAQGIEGVVLRYGQLWGDGTGTDTPDGKDMALHVDGAVSAALAALEHVPAGIYNIADDDSRLNLDKARRVLHWAPGTRADHVTSKA
ncbi:MAG: hypothetical protein GAK28_04645 [Luteibacter sp.]|uniref:NAD-dependent epimerase/dehydratase family protein n=1 Tax=Luteibacter sp. TaxID=1886636 RepID=UPI00137D6ED5|nr:NAD(P)-dependent oxidoreductase [Luteibacter sp.]KAF1003509.1 MAG: hypothetical protein GAK28_04645 [Luteibacter sp.]